MSSSMTESLIFSLPLCTMKTSLSRIDVSVKHQRGSWRAIGGGVLRICTDVSPLANLLRAADPRLVPRRSQMPSTRAGCDEPLKTMAPRMMGGPRSVRSSSSNGRTCLTLEKSRAIIIRVMSAGRRWALAVCTGPSPTRQGCKRKRSGLWQASAWARQRQMPDEAACLPACEGRWAKGDGRGCECWAGLGCSRRLCLGPGRKLFLGPGRTLSPS
jgi:hypothetical protein